MLTRTAVNVLLYWTQSCWFICSLWIILKMVKVCAVFGGSRGIGRAVAELLAQKGCRLAIIARNLEVAQSTARDLGGTYAAVPFSLLCAWVTCENSVVKTPPCSARWKGK